MADEGFAQRVGDAAFIAFAAVVIFVLWPCALPVLVAAMGPWGTLERRRVAHMAAGLALVTSVWCACVLGGAWLWKGWTG